MSTDDSVTLMRRRYEELALGDTAVAQPTATIRPDEAQIRTASLPHSGDAAAVTSNRELPKISVDLQGTYSEPDLEAAVPSKRDRDLEVVRVLGEGGMGRVFLARQHSLHREVAIKTVRDTASVALRAALLAEGAVTGYLEHPAVIPVHALGVDEAGRPVLVMKCVEGAPWSDLIANPEHPSWRYLGGDTRERLDTHLEILSQVCNAVEYAHSRGVVHRDIKPRNVLIGRYGEVYLADWGIALRLEGAVPSQALCGTPAYMAPEMVLGDFIDARTDVYLLGATLHEVLIGSPRHEGADVKATLAAAVLSASFTYPADTPDELATLANDATAAKREDRPASAAAMRGRIADYRRHKTSIALVRSAAERVENLRELVNRASGLGSESVQREIDMLSAQAGFALEEALREWPGNVAARECQLELERELEVRRARAAELERLARDLDPSVSRRQRDVLVGALSAVGVALSVSAFLGDGAPATSALFRQSLAPLAVVIVACVALRRSLLTTLVNRHSAILLLVATGAISVNRGLGLLSGVSAEHVLVFDCTMVAAVLALSAQAPFRWLALPSAMMLAAAVWAALMPGQAMSAFSLATGGAMLVSAVFARLAR